MVVSTVLSSSSIANNNNNNGQEGIECETHLLIYSTINPDRQEGWGYKAKARNRCATSSRRVGSPMEITTEQDASGEIVGNNPPP